MIADRMRRSRFNTRRLTARLLLVLFALQIAIPQGFMPDFAAMRDGRFEVVICTGTGFQTLLVDASGRPVEPGSPDNSQPSGNSDCPYTAAAAKLFTLPATMPLPDRNWHFASNVHSPIERALQPPAQGPPLGSRAPPSGLV